MQSRVIGSIFVSILVLTVGTSVQAEPVTTGQGKIKIPPGPINPGPLPRPLIPALEVHYYLNGAATEAKLTSPVKLAAKDFYDVKAWVPYQTKAPIPAKSLTVAFGGGYSCYHLQNSSIITDGPHSINRADLHGTPAPLTGKPYQVLLAQFRISANDIAPCKVAKSDADKVKGAFSAATATITVTAAGEGAFPAVKKVTFTIQ